LIIEAGRGVTGSTDDCDSSGLGSTPNVQTIGGHMDIKIHITEDNKELFKPEVSLIQEDQWVMTVRTACPMEEINQQQGVKYLCFLHDIGDLEHFEAYAEQEYFSIEIETPYDSFTAEMLDPHTYQYKFII
tara:strand:+ start:701 stop:1093 length:393 start_codon:yes stop_codon:yes gene_type:complete